MCLDTMMSLVWSKLSWACTGFTGHAIDTYKPDGIKHVADVGCVGRAREVIVNRLRLALVQLFEHLIGGDVSTVYDVYDD